MIFVFFIGLFLFWFTMGIIYNTCKDYTPELYSPKNEIKPKKYRSLFSIITHNGFKYRS